MHALDDQPKLEAVGRGRTILLVDDNAASLTSLTRRLTAYEFQVISAPSVDAAVAALTEAPALDLVIADEIMPQGGALALLAILRNHAVHARVPFIMLSLFGVEHDAVRWAHHPDAISSKPVRAAKLKELITKLLKGQHVPTLPPADTTDVLPRLADRRILLVDDNLVNQRVAQRALERLAAHVTIANNGAEALERIAQSSFDAVLMDCQMPVMDGFSATRRIRESEAQSGHPRLPIIALSANAMIEDRERCIAAGMDDHLAKPVDMARLGDCLTRHLPAVPTLPAVDLNALRELTGGDEVFERELIAAFVSSGDQCLAEIVEALKTQDLETVSRRAHSLKGASANLHAFALSSAASELEEAARAKSVAAVDPLVARLRERLAAVNQQLAKVS
jgi:CheY-like chemotaxis protein